MKVQMKKVFEVLASRRVAKFGLMAFVCVGLGSLHACRQDDMTTSQQPSAETHKSGLVNLDLGDIELDPEVAISVASTTTSARGIELATKADGRLPNFQFTLGQNQTEEDFPVVLGLVGAKQDIDCYAQATWKLIKKLDETTGKMRYYVRAKASTTTFSPAPDYSKLTEGEDWFLHALYAPGGTWNDATKSWVYKPTHKVTKLFALGEKLTIGKDIDIPFVLGSNRKTGGWFEGYPMTATKKFDKATNTYYWNFGIKQLYENPSGKTLKDKGEPFNPRFKMQGALYAFTLENAQKQNVPFSSDDKDDAFIAKLSNRPVYDYLIKAFFVESTVATNEVRYKFDKLRLKVPEALREQPTYKSALNGGINFLSPGYGIRAEAVTNPTLERPTRIHFPISDGTNDLSVGKKSKVFYFWMSDIDADEMANKTEKGDGTSLSVNLYNKTYKMTTGMKNIYTFVKKEHKSNAIYRTDVSINEEASFNPLARMAPGYISRNKSGIYFFSDAMSDIANNAPNNLDKDGNPGSGQLFNAKEVREIGENKQTANFSKVNSFSNLNGDNGTVTFNYSDLKWIVPDKYDIYSVFPYNENGQTISDGVFRHGQADKLITQTNEQVRLDGRRMKNVTSYYYREKTTSKADQTNDYSRDVVYAYRFVGTSYATVFRYTLLGAWEKPGNGLTPSTNSRLQIEARSVGNKYKYNKANPSEAEAKKLFKDEFIKDSFWESKDVLKRRLFVKGEQVNSNVQYIGQRLNFWTRPRKGEYPGRFPRPEGTAGLYYITRQDVSEGGMLWKYGNAAQTTGNNVGSPILFWLSVDQSK